MEVIPLQSGSSGNCTYVESGGFSVLFDAGISGRQAELRLQKHGKDIRKIDALVISHEHSDHVRCIGVFNRKYGLPIHVTRPTLRAFGRHQKHGKLDKINLFESGESFRIGNLTIDTLPTPHDAVDGVAFVVDDGVTRFGLLTDLGHVFDGLADTIATLDAVVLESNFDAEMLIDAPYPDFLKSRIAGDGGHISNDEAAELLRRANPNLQWAVLAHLSEHCNEPAVAMRTHRRILGSELNIECADRNDVSRPMKIEPSKRQAEPGHAIQQSLFSQGSLR